MENVNETIIQLIRSEVCGGTLSLHSPITDEDLKKIHSVAHMHDMSHIVSSVLLNNGMVSGSPFEFHLRERVYKTLYRYENRCYVIEKVSNVLEDEKIPYILLKGAVIMNLYPQPWMRTGCDIDILVHKEDVRRATDAITKNLGYEDKGAGKHDIQILSTEKIYVELHFSLIEDNVSPAMVKVLDKVWSFAKPCEEGKYRYELDDAMFYFYHIAHMAKHFICGGCGIRPFLDLWLIEKSKNYETAETEALLKKGELTDFAKAVKKLSQVWFSGEEHDKVTKVMEEFIFNGGCFGTGETILFARQQKTGGRLSFVLSRIFVPYSELKKQYPIIEKYKFLMPICEFCRIFSLLFGKKRKFRKSYVKKMNEVSEKYFDDISFLFESVGL